MCCDQYDSCNYLIYPLPKQSYSLLIFISIEYLKAHGFPTFFFFNLGAMAQMKTPLLLVFCGHIPFIEASHRLFVESLHLAGISVSQLVTEIVLRLLKSSKHRTQCAVLCRLVCCIHSQRINWPPMCLLVSC